MTSIDTAAEYDFHDSFIALLATGQQELEALTY